MSVSVQAEDFDIGAEIAALETAGGGAVASFTGIVRGGGGLQAMLLEHYPGMTERALADIVAEAHARWPLLGVRVIHRHGTLTPGQRIVFVGTASSHRAAALEACAFVIDWLKTSAPFWKRERYEGGDRWVEAKAEDDAAKARWS